jgi:Ca-activated chloride channel family protein
MVDTLTERDRFSVYAFDDRIDTVPEFGGPGLAAASDRNRFRAVEFLAKVEARGGTEMARPLDLAVNQLASGGRQPPEAPSRDRILVLITDGQVGNEDQILRLLGKRLAGFRIFTLGIDQAVNEGFLKRLATLGGGFCEVVESEDRLDEVMKRLHSRIGTPLLTGLKLEEAGFGIAAEATVPSRLPDLFAGAALQVMGRYQGVPEGSFLVSGQDAAGRRWCEAVSSRVSDNPALAKAWARAYVRELEDRFVTGQGDVRELEKRIIEVSLKYEVLCRFTSYVAVDQSEVVNEGGTRHGIVQPVEMPAGWRNAAPEARLSACLGSAPPTDAYGAPLDTESVDSYLMLSPEAESVDMDFDDQAQELTRGASKPKPPPPPPAATPRGFYGRKKRKAPPSPKKAPGGSPGLLGKVFGFFKKGKGKQEAAVPAPEALDLSAYRRRAADLLEPIKRGSGLSGPQRLHELGVLAVSLKALIEDLTSVGAPPLELRPLQMLHADLTALTAQPSPDEAAVEKLWAQAEEVLRVFAGVPAEAPAAGRREGFWK